MRSGAPARAPLAPPRRRSPLPTKLHAIRQSGNAVRTFSYAARLLILGTSSGAPNWHQPRQSSPSNTRAACAVPARTRASFRSRLGGAVPLLSSWNPMHQQPPKTPLLRSTSAANAGQVDSSSALTTYAGTTTRVSTWRWLDGCTAGRQGQRSAMPPSASAERPATSGRGLDACHLLECVARLDRPHALEACEQDGPVDRPVGRKVFGACRH